MLQLALLGGKPVRDKFLPYFLPTVEQEEINEVVDTLKSDWITTGPKTHKFEEMFKEYVGCKTRHHQVCSYSFPRHQEKCGKDC